MMEILNKMAYLSNNERQALSTFVVKSEQEFRNVIVQIVLYGSATRGDRGEDSDLDLLIITSSEDWRKVELFRSANLPGLAKVSRVWSAEGDSI